MTCIGVALIVAWMKCSALAAVPPAGAFCEIYKPVSWHASDTRKTKEQVDLNNRKWKALCAPKPR